MLDLLTDSVQISNIYTSEPQNELYEYDCIIPDILPDAGKILSVHTTNEINSVENTHDIAKIHFNLIYRVLYIPIYSSSDDISPVNKVKAFTAVSENTITTKGLFTENCQIKPILNVENIGFSLINSRKITIKTSVNCISEIETLNQREICTNLSGLDDIQTEKENIQLLVKGQNISDNFTLSENIELSNSKAPYKEILKSDALICDVIVSNDDDNLQIKGNINICTLYIADDASESMQIMENEISFVHNIPIDACENSLWHTELSLKDFNIQIASDSDNENRILNVDLKIIVDAKSFMYYENEILKDAYSLSQDLELKKESISAYSQADNINMQFVLKEAISLGDNLPLISQIINTTANICEYYLSIENDRLFIKGNIIYNIFYISGDSENPVSVYTSKHTFSQEIDIPYFEINTEYIIAPSINHISFNIMSSKEIELRASINIKGLYFKCLSFDLITEASVLDIPNIDIDSPSIRLYVVQENDSIWKIAKRYHAPIEILTTINNITSTDLIMPGQKLLIPG